MKRRVTDKLMMLSAVIFAGMMLSVFLLSVTASAGEPSVNWKVVSQELNDQDQYVYDGNKTDFTMNGVVQKSSDGRWGYVSNGIVINTDSVLVPNWNGWWHIVNGWSDMTNRVLDTTTGKYLFTNGIRDFTANQTIVTGGTTEWYLADGKVESGYTGLALAEDGIWWVTNGKKDTGKNGMVKDTIGVTPDNGWIYMKNGQFDPNADGVEMIHNDWWRIRNGVVDATYTGLASNSSGWWYLENGRVRFDYNGAAQNEYGIWCINGGNITFDFTGSAYGYYFVNSFVQ